MSIRDSIFTPEILDYLRQINEPEAPILAQIRANTANHRLGKMAIDPSQAALLTWLARLMGAKKYLEIGVFTGYSSTAMALALPEHGRLSCCDINISFTDIAQQNWQNAGIAHKIKLYLQPALITLDELIQAGEAESYDIALIDADKPPTPQYYERCLQLVRRGGIIAIDNLLLNGRITCTANANSAPSHAILQSFNCALPYDSRIVPLTLPLGDGLTLLLKK